MLCANVLIDWNCFSGERCGPWASCLFLLLDGIRLVWPLLMEQAIRELSDDEMLIFHKV